jgi:hypothetical protein
MPPKSQCMSVAGSAWAPAAAAGVSFSARSIPTCQVARLLSDQGDVLCRSDGPEGCCGGVATSQAAARLLQVSASAAAAPARACWYRAGSSPSAWPLVTARGPAGNRAPKHAPVTFNAPRSWAATVLQPLHGAGASPALPQQPLRCSCGAGVPAVPRQLHFSRSSWAHGGSGRHVLQATALPAGTAAGGNSSAAAVAEARKGAGIATGARPPPFACHAVH